MRDAPEGLRELGLAVRKSVEEDEDYAIVPR
jgi:hypothetical protein